MTTSSFVRSGKVRDLYAIGADRLLLVASDRISAFDVVLPTAVPDKGKVLTGLSRFWLAETAAIVANHLLATDLDDVDPMDWPRVAGDDRRARADELRGRVMVCRRVDVLPVEVIVRGYVAGSGWKDYAATGSISGIRLPAGLREGDRLPEPILTPSTKADLGLHDETITFDVMAKLVGTALAEKVRSAALRLYEFGAGRCEPAGIILADTKFEFGVWPGDEDLVLVDEVLTPDSSRFWDAAAWSPGGPQSSFDKQYVRDWLETQPWDKRDPGPELPPHVVAGTRARYVEAFERITGARFDRYLEEDRIDP
ncbi:MAG TPA: phosphoribosylaminoimidazolesuccinocarboxamide synthase [Candidatus Limnocylindrales bacterium]|jgi:phosphoribosylaminoimidazole-succinocarboxamide synthase|nr:phosphoribosylaminoimidazolesuccinocarboxamide synthase [Candidatus Limnocylindrales bacterium]